MNTTKENKRTTSSAVFKHAEAEIYAYKETKREIARIRDHIIHSTTTNDENTGAGKNSYRTPGRPTERIITRLMMDKRLRNLEEIVEAIEDSYAQIPDEYKKVIDMKYWGNKNLTIEGVALECGMHRNTAQKYRKEFVELVICKIGW